jgi:NADH dehydrogenase
MTPAPPGLPADAPRVVIVGGGFAGLTAARALAGAPCRVLLIDRRNHHLFQPLLYQVATAMLSPADIAVPIRHVLRRRRRVEVIMGEVERVDATRRVVTLAGGGDVAYDYLLLATGATHSYLGHEAWEPFAPGLKTIDDALAIRARFLRAFEAAEIEPDPARRRGALTFVVVGAGPTGVELAGSMMEIARHAIPRDFRHIDTSTARIVLVEAMERVLPAFPPGASARARAHLRDLGVEVRTGARVTAIDATGVVVSERGVETRIDAHSAFWAAGVRASSLGASLEAPRDAAGRIEVRGDLSIPGRPEVMVLGDLARVRDARYADGSVPGMSPGAIQMGRFAARLVRGELDARRRGLPPPTRPAFRYRDKGMLATIGRNKAVACLHGRVFGGLVAWLLWAIVHVFFLIGFRNRIIVMLEWAWAYVTYQRGARLITGDVPRRAQGS